jgi:hypothetical protein
MRGHERARRRRRIIPARAGGSGPDDQLRRTERARSRDTARPQSNGLVLRWGTPGAVRLRPGGSIAWSGATNARGRDVLTHYLGHEEVTVAELPGAARRSPEALG